MVASMQSGDLKAVLNELEALKKLMVLNMLDKGYSQSQIALALGVGQATVSRMFPAGVLKKNKRVKKPRPEEPVNDAAAG